MLGGTSPEPGFPLRRETTSWNFWVWLRARFRGVPSCRKDLYCKAQYFMNGTLQILQVAAVAERADQTVRRQANAQFTAVKGLRHHVLGHNGPRCHSDAS